MNTKTERQRETVQQGGRAVVTSAESKNSNLVITAPLLPTWETGRRGERYNFHSRRFPSVKTALKPFDPCCVHCKLSKNHFL